MTFHVLLIVLLLPYAVDGALVLLRDLKDGVRWLSERLSA